MMAEESNEDEVRKVQDFISSQVKATLAEMQAAEAQSSRQSQRSSSDDAHQQMKEALDPYIKPDLDANRMTALAASDEARFYRKTAGASEYEDQIEQTFEQLMKIGRPMSRNDIYKYIVGKQATEEPDKFYDKISEQRKVAVARAEGAADLGYASSGREKEMSTFKNFDKLTTEEMEKALEGVTF